ncbi:hypothetical protein EPUS_06917 [Endocarpon pusillum Z07020]|uniref:DUF1772-domain-containing protein n=1 Tax=Endocarpon pusillum (strain Z07020 / HMAS-L-300199) TaxID=1263415 RepID=U1G8U6_ENDPU|nr:uncharacterized protein EPUS_06917 [Endocarpon pusillum Z07020]ERF68106.1 hypothetical protein EPUS_06917 [Endocarpon pusillum Z07020]
MSTLGAQATAVISGSFLSGAMMSLSLMAVPVLLDTTNQAPQLFHQWTRMYHYGHQVLPTLAVGTFLLYGYTSIKKRSTKQSWATFALAGITTLSMLPFTWIFMVPTNNELFRLEELSKAEPLVKGMAEAKELVVKWSWLHLTRSLFPLMGAVMGTLGTFAK